MEIKPVSAEVGPEPDALAGRGAPAHRLLHDAGSFRDADRRCQSGDSAARRAGRLTRARAGVRPLPVSLDRAGRLQRRGKRLEAESAGKRGGPKKRRDAGKRRGLLGEPLMRELPTLILLRADREARFGLVRGVLRQAQKQGFGRFSLVVERSPQP